MFSRCTAMCDVSDGGCVQPGEVWKAEVKSPVREVGGFLRVVEDSGMSEKCEII